MVSIFMFVDNNNNYLTGSKIVQLVMMHHIVLHDVLTVFSSLSLSHSQIDSFLK